MSETMDTVRVTVRPDGVAVLTLDDPSRSVNALNRRFGENLAGALARVNADPGVAAVVLASAKSDFVVGADLGMLDEVGSAATGERLARELAEAFRTLSNNPKPVVAAVHGQALGGGFELALACRAIVASTDARTAFGLPEVKLGLLPGANGLLRVAARAGLQVAVDLGLTGKSVRAAKALKLGLCDETCSASILVDVAAGRAMTLAGDGATGSVSAAARGDRKSSRAAGRSTKSARAKATDAALEGTRVGRRVLFRKARAATRQKTFGNYPATEHIIDVLERYGDDGFDAAADLEARAFGELLLSDASKRLRELFAATQALKKDTGTDDPNFRVRVPERIGVLGAGLMGAGIAYVSIDTGAIVRLKDRDDASLCRGLAYVRGILDGRVRRKSLTPLARDAEFARLTTTTDYSGFRSVDIVVEAVFEDLELKQRIVREVESVTRADCIFATNTSSIPVGKIAEASQRPETVIGMHYFSPVHKMPLLEVVRTDANEPWVVATAVALGKRQGKTVIVVNDGPGFYTSRILAPYMNEAAWLLSEGVPVEEVDGAMLQWGYPVGPFQLLDEVGIDVGAHVAHIMFDAFGERMVPPETMRALLDDDRKGRKNKRGFYIYEGGEGEGGRKGTPVERVLGTARSLAKRAQSAAQRSRSKGGRPVDTSLYKTLGIEPNARLTTTEIQLRCGLQMVNEAARCLDEGTLRSPRDGDVGAVFGLGFPPFRGGPFRYLDTLGAADALRRIQGFHDRFGARWEPAPYIIDLAKRAGRVYG